MTENIKPIQKLFAIRYYDKNGKSLKTTFHEDISEEEVRKKLQIKYGVLSGEWIIEDFSDCR
jgi:hypothetical protein